MANILDIPQILWRCLTTLGSDEDERKLRDMAEAAGVLADDIDKVGPTVEKSTGKLRKAWHGDARAEFDEWLKIRRLDPEARKDLAGRCRLAQTTLVAAADATKETKRQFRLLLKVAVEVILQGIALSAVMGGIAVWWVRAAPVLTRLVGQAPRILGILVAFLARVARLLSKLKIMKLGLYSKTPVSFGQAFRSALQGYTKVSLWSLGGNYAAGEISRLIMHPFNSKVRPFDWSVQGLAELLFVGGAGGAFGTLGRTTGLVGLGARNPLLRNMAIGFAAGSIPTIIIDRAFGKDPKPWVPRGDKTSLKNWMTDSTLFDGLFIGTVAGGANGAVGRLFPDSSTLSVWARNNADRLGLTIKPDPARLAGFRSTIGLDPNGRYIRLPTRDMAGDPFALYPPREMPTVRADDAPLWVRATQNNAMARGFSNLNTMVQSSILGFVPSTAIRAVVPFNAGSPPPALAPGTIYPDPVHRTDHVTPRIPDPPAQPPPPPPQQHNTVGGGRVQISTGGTLSEISRQVYGTDAYWRTIYNANRNVIGPDPNLLKQGVFLTIPEIPVPQVGGR
ncbi:hypothetical protein [Nonomuraea sediminis]|uniref:hypothetical protein n=1 Tax=Nonomuraea sediminis TaxID=2835864 RepID=UPI001BDCD7ED|nr:hypothetical protein [Nonomuraea sediminis]